MSEKAFRGSITTDAMSGGVSGNATPSASLEGNNVLQGSLPKSAALAGSLPKQNNIRGSVTYPEKIYGKSAYEVAVMNGFVGTETEWLESLQGEDGYTPKRGVDYYTDSDKDELVTRVLNSLPRAEEVSV